MPTIYEFDDLRLPENMESRFKWTDRYRHAMDDYPCFSRISCVGYDTAKDEIVDAVVVQFHKPKAYLGRVDGWVYAIVWIDGVYGAMCGRADGCGYNKTSAAFQFALDAGGVELMRNGEVGRIDGAGIHPKAMRFIAAKMNPNLRAIRLVY